MYNACHIELVPGYKGIVNREVCEMLVSACSEQYYAWRPSLEDIYSHCNKYAIFVSEPISVFSSNPYIMYEHFDITKDEIFIDARMKKEIVIKK